MTRYIQTIDLKLYQLWNQYDINTQHRAVRAYTELYNTKFQTIVEEIQKTKCMHAFFDLFLVQTCANSIIQEAHALVATTIIFPSVPTSPNRSSLRHESWV